MIKERILSNETLLEMWLGTVLFGVVCQVGLVWFIKDKLGYSLGLWLGIVAALLTILHLSVSLDKALDLGEGGAKKHMVTQNLVRYFVLIIFLVVLMITDFANPLAAFLGLMGVKAGAYLQPVLHKVFGKIRNKNKK
ncbi:MAG: ATP synthase subunit I [Lachnospiraceae bacterium]|nr:ATP synthase subunit I [Lachnospiraceae bacterium]